MLLLKSRNMIWGLDYLSWILSRQSSAACVLQRVLLYFLQRYVKCEGVLLWCIHLPKGKNI